MIFFFSFCCSSKKCKIITAAAVVFVLLIILIVVLILVLPIKKEKEPTTVPPSEIPPLPTAGKVQNVFTLGLAAWAMSILNEYLEDRPEKYVFEIRFSSIAVFNFSSNLPNVV